MARYLKTIPLVACAVVCAVGNLGGCTKPSNAPQADAERQDQTEAPATSAPEKLPVVATPDKPARRTPVAKILGKEIFEDDLVPPAGEGSDNASLTEAQRKNYRKEKLSSLIWRPLMELYCQRHQIEATPEEIEQYQQAMQRSQTESLEELRAQREAAGTTDEERERLSEQIQLIAGVNPGSGDDNLAASLLDSLKTDALTEARRRDVAELTELLEAQGTEPPEQRMLGFFKAKLGARRLSDEDRRLYSEYAQGLEENLQLFAAIRKIPESMVKSWKFNRALHAEFGGVVIFQQMNPAEPVGAYRQWLEAHEQAGDFEILDDEAREAFWRYLKDDHESTTWVVRDPDPFGQPWWLKNPNEATAE